MNKTVKELGSDNYTLYCEIKEKRISQDGLCPWHDDERKFYDREDLL